MLARRSDLHNETTPPPSPVLHPDDRVCPTLAVWESDARTDRYGVAPDWPRVRGYEVLSVIGSGGMATVYKARHLDLRRVVALKTIRAADLAEAGALERFYAEAEAVARLQHPSIIQVFEIGTLDPQPGGPRPGPFIALEYVDGGSLLRHVHHPQPPRFAAGVVEKLARAAQFAHAAGVIHRDLKPANVLLTAAGEPKIADFGVAKQLRAEAGADRCLTRAGIVMGTPEYMAPEQASGKPPAAAVDVYALGVILYELLTARVPFQGAGPYETMELVRGQDPVSPRRLQPRLPRDLETICLKCLEKEPARRYATAEGLADDLRRFLDDRPIHARRVGPAGRVGRWCKRNPLVAASVAAAAAAVLAAFVLITFSYWRSEQARKDVAEQRDEAQRREKAERWERYRADVAAAADALQVYNVGGARRALESSPEGHRNWEWRYFYGQLDPARHVLDGAPGGTGGGGEVSADGRRVVVFNERGVRVWDTAGPRELFRLTEAGPLYYIALSPDGRTLAHRPAETAVALHDVDANRPLAVLRGHQGRVIFVAFSPDSRHVITGDAGGTSRVWDARTGAPVRVALPGDRPLDCVAYSRGLRRMTYSDTAAPAVRVADPATGRLIATIPHPGRTMQSVDFDGTGDRVVTREQYPVNTLRLWDAATGRKICDLEGHKNTVAHFAHSPDGTRVASASTDQTVGLWDAKTGRPVAFLRGHIGRVLAVAFSPDGRRLASASEDRTVRVWDGRTGEPLAVLPGHTGDVTHVVYTADGRGIVSTSADGTARVWDARAAETGNAFREHRSFVYGVAFHPGGGRVASASWDGTARVWDAATGAEVAVLAHEPNAIVSSVAFHPSGATLATRSREAVRLWDAATGREVRRWAVPNGGWRDTRVAFDRRGDRLAAGCANNTVRVWDVATGAEVAVLAGHEEAVRDVAFSPDGRWLASAGDKVVRVWDVATGKQAHALAGHAAPGYAVAFNADGTLLASAATDGTVRVWETETWESVKELRHGTNVYGVAFSPDGTRLACACADNSIRFWDLATYQEVADLRGHSAYVHQVAFSADGSRLVSASGDGTLRVWDSRPPRDRWPAGVIPPVVPGRDQPPPR